ncbi:MAG: FAD-dependent oxidoreductase [Oscillospiraceae bacterium]|nr:FAD-dependent oxidoreductase [Oscillospiraceae bacterium]
MGLSSVRVMPVCLVTGQASGTAAALACAQNEVDVHAMDVTALRETLRENGAYFL